MKRYLFSLLLSLLLPASVAKAQLNASVPRESKPGAPNVIYLDFDGEIVSGTDWNADLNGGANLTTTLTSISNNTAGQAAVDHVWKMVSEDFRPFDVNVTTRLPAYTAAASSRRAMIVFTNTRSWYTPDQQIPGVAYFLGWGVPTQTTGFVFVDNATANYSNWANRASHIVGRMIGLGTDGLDTFPPVAEYFGGNQWGPIMGRPFTNAVSNAVTQWSKGEYTSASNNEDDIQLIAEKLATVGGAAPVPGVTAFRTDEVGRSSRIAEPLVLLSGNRVGKTGAVISSSADTDYYLFNVPEVGSTRIDIKPFAALYNTVNYYNLDVRFNLYKQGGAAYSSQTNPFNPELSFTATQDLNLPVGRYYLAVSGAAKTGAYPAYGSVGQYDVDITVPGTPKVLTVSPFEITGRSDQGGTYTVTVTSNYAWTASRLAPWLRFSPSFGGANGVNTTTTVTVRVLPNGRDVARSGEIDFDGVIHTAYQNAGTGIALPIALESTGTFATGGDYDGWFGQVAYYKDLSPDTDRDAAMAELYEPGQVAWMERVVNGPGTATFYWSVSSETGFDKIRFRVDSEEVALLTGDMSGLTDETQLTWSPANLQWQQVSFNIPVGQHTLSWFYFKDTSNTSGLDGAWVDRFNFTPIPTIEVTPETAIVPAAGQAYDLAVRGNLTNWTVTGLPAWITATPTTGSNDATVRLTVAPNPTQALRTATITIGTAGVGGVTDTHVVTQDPAPPPAMAQALDSPGLIFTTGGDQPWIYQTAVRFDGVDSAQSGAITDGQESWFETSLNGPTILRYYRKVSSESGKDFLKVFANGLEMDSTSGEVDWTQAMLELPAGTHTVRWVYLKDASGLAGSDRAWVDTVTAAPPLSSTSDRIGSGGEVYTVRTNFDGPWTVSVPEVDWLNVWPRSGNGPATITIAVTRNLTKATRTAAVQIGAYSHMIQQDGVDSITVAPEAKTVGAGGQTYDLLVGSTGPLWRVTGAPAWVTFVPAASPLGTAFRTPNAGAVPPIGTNTSDFNNLLRVTVAANPLATPRTATLTFSNGSLLTSHVITQLGTSTELFEAVDNSDLIILGGGDASWIFQNVAAHVQSGGDSAQSGPITHGQTSVMQTVVSGPSVLTYQRKVSSELNKDFLRVTLNGVEQEAVSGTAAFTLRTIHIPVGTHTVRWTYSKDAAGSVGDDKAWVDAITLRSSVDPLYTRVINSGGTYTITVNLPAGTPWTATESLPWASLSAASGTGPGVVTVTVQSNAPAAGFEQFDRSGFITITSNPTLPSAQPFIHLLSQDGLVQENPSLYISLDMPDSLPGRNSTWRYLDTGADPGATWKNNTFNDATWASGNGIIGFGNLGAEPATPANPFATFGTPLAVNSARITTYFRRSFPVTDKNAFGSITMSILRDDGVVVYLNGKEILRDNMPAAPAVITNSTQALAAAGGDDEKTYFDFPLNPNDLIVGTNVLAVELHQSGTASSDLGFDLGLSTTSQIVLEPQNPAFPNWFGQRVVTHDGDEAAQAPTLDPGGVSTFEMTIGSGVLSFWWKTQSEGLGDVAFLEEQRLDGLGIPYWERIRTYSGDSPWKQETVAFTNDGINWPLDTPRRIRFGYEKNLNDFAYGLDTAWIDEIRFERYKFSVTHENAATGSSATLSPLEQVHYLRVIANQEWTLTMPTLTSWIRVQDGVSLTGTGDALIPFIVTANNSGAARQANLSFLAGNVSRPPGTTLPITITQGTLLPLLPSVDNITLGITTGGDKVWVGQNAVTNDTIDAGASIDLDDNQESWMEARILGPGTLRYFWRTDSEDNGGVEFNGDSLSFLLDGASVANISGNVPWAERIENLPAGVHTVRWRYKKNSALSVGADAAYVDQIRWTASPQTIADSGDNSSVNLATTTWFGQITDTHDGVDALASGDVDSNQSSSMTASVTGPGTFSFWWLVDSDPQSDFLRFKINGTVYKQISGLFNRWEQIFIVLPAGVHNLEWVYEKDAANTYGQDRGWVDEIFWSGAANVKLNPLMQTVPQAGQTYTVAVTATGAWSVANIPAWATITPTSGSGNGTLNVTVSANGATVRTGNILVGGISHIITQSGSSPAVIPVGPTVVDNLDITRPTVGGPLLIKWNSDIFDSFRVQKSTNALDWEDIGGITATQLETSFNYHVLPGVPRLFIRLVKLP